MSRLTSLLLLFAFVLPGISPALAMGARAERNLPACCRRDGAHHCMMSLTERQAMADAQGDEARFRAPVEQCPYCPATVPGAVHAPAMMAAVGQMSMLPPASRAKSVTQTASRLRMAQVRARQKRGPPAVRSL